ncbi:DUF2189 domain-containing protein [Pseudorhodobacter sp.]|uniref:DUF2189 domain-containing protein n=1 Tax=Pseudorhodobacter sp. TaxID=1934400 RepID=UPI00264A1CC6|nr:DUF2189 domain-containing protein [Pseudorhodobacter sp.]MDN5785611.1 DUF2189 domain-containing protein [Pseudorhodobacter sp.]
MFESIPPVEPRARPATNYHRDLRPLAAQEWLAAGWADFRRNPGQSLAYGFAVFLLSAVIVLGLFHLDFPNLIFPALSGFLVVGPLLAVGLYEKSRRLQAGQSTSLSHMIVTRPRSGGQFLFAGLLLCTLVMLWLRAADLLYALFFGMVAFPGFDHILTQVFATPRGLALVAVGSAVGGLFAAFAMSISLFSIPMLLERRTDALTALGTSFALTTKNLRAVLPWGAIVVIGFVLCAATGLLGLIVIFPVLGHGTWHAWRAMNWPAGVDE